jgi:hypothetical protein
MGVRISQGLFWPSISAAGGKDRARNDFDNEWPPPLSIGQFLSR